MQRNGYKEVVNQAWGQDIALRLEPKIDGERALVDVDTQDYWLEIRHSQLDMSPRFVIPKADLNGNKLIIPLNGQPHLLDAVIPAQKLFWALTTSVWVTFVGIKPDGMKAVMERILVHIQK